MPVKDLWRLSKNRKKLVLSCLKSAHRRDTEFRCRFRANSITIVAMTLNTDDHLCHRLNQFAVPTIHRNPLHRTASLRNSVLIPFDPRMACRCKEYRKIRNLLRCFRKFFLRF
ncbi:MAG: hypothetical protein DWI02_04665 [Planctomycetota bacterium]|nr:MAG: hypothetical protein DWI02_04665 [Planctomycetota bacterium]